MAHTVYGICLVISVLVIFWMVSRNYRNMDVSYWTIVSVVPLINLGYWLQTGSVTKEAAELCYCLIYLDSTVLLMVLVFRVLRIIGVNVASWMKLAGYAAAFVHLFIVWSCVGNGLYFRSVRLVNTSYGLATRIEDGPLHVYHYIYLAAVFLVLIGSIIYGIVRKGIYSRRSLWAYAYTALIGVVLYAVEWFSAMDFSLLPILYVLGVLVIAVNYDNIHAHDITCIIPDRMESSDARGYAAFDLHQNFLSCNRKMFDFWPEFARQNVDEPLPENSPLRKVFYSLIEAYELRHTSSLKCKVGEMTCVCRIEPFSVSPGSPTQGYFFSVRDASEEQRAMDVMASYNESLNAEVAAKTESIQEIQQKIVTGMANMVENRDNNTGGHVKRTSDIIRILIDEIQRQGIYRLDNRFARDVVRAAPMHDLGKMNIENSILNKPAKLTDEEYEIMKTHATKSGEIVMILLDGVEEAHFVRTAYAVARYHHERWDGRGYPEHLVGSMIPLEARIMAVADVYDALACKRSYKPAMAPELVAKIMLEGMGTQFDPALKPVFLACRKKLEAYYQKDENR